MNLDQLKNSIDALTAKMAEKVLEETPQEIFALLEQRQPMLANLIALHPSKEELRGYLTALRARDQEVMTGIAKLQKQLQGSLSNFGNLREYLVF